MKYPNTQEVRTQPEILMCWALVTDDGDEPRCTSFVGDGRQGSGEVTGVVTVVLSASSLGPDDVVA